MNAKTSILEELNVPEEQQQALSREAMRQGKPLNQLLREFFLAKADQVMAAASSKGGHRHKAA